jgi:hypothetical protein
MNAFGLGPRIELDCLGRRDRGILERQKRRTIVGPKTEGDSLPNHRATDRVQPTRVALVELLLASWPELFAARQFRDDRFHD